MIIDNNVLKLVLSIDDNNNKKRVINRDSKHWSF